MNKEKCKEVVEDNGEVEVRGEEEEAVREEEEQVGEEAEVVIGAEEEEEEVLRGIGTVIDNKTQINKNLIKTKDISVIHFQK